MTVIRMNLKLDPALHAEIVFALARHLKDTGKEVSRSEWVAEAIRRRLDQDEDDRRQAVRAELFGDRAI